MQQQSNSSKTDSDQEQLKRFQNLHSRFYINDYPSNDVLFLLGDAIIHYLCDPNQVDRGHKEHFELQEKFRGIYADVYDLLKFEEQHTR